MSTTVLVAIVVGLMPLVSQYIAAHFGHKAKRLDTVYARKADAYRQLIERAATLAYETEPEENYRQFMLAHQSARLVSSPRVDRTLVGPDGLMASAWELRMAKVRSYDEYDRYKGGPWHQAIDRTIEAMHQDLMRLSR